MAEMRRVGGQTIVDYMARDYDSILRSMREQIPYKLPEWTDYESEADFGNVLLQLFAHMGDLLSYYQDRVANESFLGTAQTRRSIIHHLRLIGYRLATAAPASTELTLDIPAGCEETILIRRGDAFATRSSRDRPSVRFEYSAEQPLVVDCRDLVTAGGRKVFHGVPVEEGRLVSDELLGTSDGTPNQRFPLAHPRLIVRSLGQGQAINRDVDLRTEVGAVVTEWKLQESLAFGRANQHDFVVEIDENDQASVLFGDGSFGAIPPAGAVVRATYRVGGGTHGNVPAGSIETIVDAPQLALLAAKVTNVRTATGGAERESIHAAVSHAPAVFRSLRRAVTAQDYEALAREFSGVGKVRARATHWNTVTLYVAPEGGGHVSDVLAANLLAYFEDKRTVTTTIEIDDVDYVAIHVTAEVRVVSYYSPARVVEKVREAAGRLLAFEAVDFGQPVFLSKFYEAIEDVDGVAAVTITEFRPRRSTPAEAEDYVVIGPDPVADEARGPLLVARTGKIPLADNEVPTPPDEGAYPDYAGGIRVLLPGERRE
jgi:hypothetical protein